MTTKFVTQQSKFKQVLRSVNPPAQRRAIMQTGVIVQRKAGTFIPNAYLEKVLAENPNGWGACMVTVEGDKSLLMINSSETQETLEFFQTTQKEFNERNITFYFCASPDALNKADLSPYPLVYKDDEPQIVAFFDGNFPGKVQKDSSHPPEHFWAQQLSDKLTGVYDALDEDLGDLIDNIERKKFRDELLSNCVSRGTVLFIASNGKEILHELNDKSHEFPWGWVSNTYGYAEGDGKKEASAPVEKPKAAFPSRSTVREKAPVQASAAIKEVVSPPKTEATAIKNYSVKKWKPDGGLSRKQRMNAYKQKIGYLPQGWVDCVAVDVYYDPQGKMMDWGAVKALGLQAPAVVALAKNPPPVGKDVEPHEIEGRDAPESKAVTAEVLPIMGPKTREHIKDMMRTPKVQKIIGENSEIITDPRILKGIEEKFADFSRQLGATSMDEYATWTYEMMLELGKTNPDGLAVMNFTFRNLWLKSRAPEIKEELKSPDNKVAFPKRKAG